MSDDGFQDTCGSAYGWVDELFRILGIEVEWRSGVLYDVYAFDGFVECTLLFEESADSIVEGIWDTRLCDISNYDEFEFSLVDIALERLL